MGIRKLVVLTAAIAIVLAACGCAGGSGSSKNMTNRMYKLINEALAQGK